MNISDPVAQAMALLLAQQASQAPAEKVVTRNLPKKEGKAKPTHSEKAQVVKHKTGEGIFGLSLPEKGTITAADFIIAIRNVGKRPFQAINMLGDTITVIKVDASQVRNDTIKAIAGFVGYDPRESFAGQDTAARQEAARQIGYARTNGATYKEERQTFRTVQGYTAGVADHNAKRLADLKAQETAIVERIIGHEKVGETVLATVERARLQSVQADLAYMGHGGKFADSLTGR